ncbi:hypothetical protein [Hippea jasoniae]|uniref:hypothetical protein n=1 Tax=Hippea jasoniae TaxID=944479 RepID=UPI000555F2D7|nr:hypothetical protein [Hippea jasoniae]
MKHFIATLFFLFFFAINGFSATVFDEVAQNIAANLRIVKGKVIDYNAKNNTVKLNKGLRDGLFKNYFVYIYKKEGSFVPFDNSKPIQIKKGVAYADVVKVYNNSAVAKITQGIDRKKKYLIGLGLIPNGETEVYGKPQKGDFFVAGKKAYRVAIITRSQVIFNGLREAFLKQKRFFVIPVDKLQIAIVKHRINSLYEAKAIKKLANVVDADIVVVLNTLKHKKLRFKVYNGYSGYEMMAETLPIDRQTQVVLNQNIQNVPASNLVASNLRLRPKLTFWEAILNRFGLYSPYNAVQISSNTFKVTLYKDIGYNTTAFYLGNIDGKLKDEIVFAQGSVVYVYRFDIDSFDQLYKFTYGYNIINIDTANINGKVLVAITNLDRYGALDSAVGYIKNKRFIAIKKHLPYHLRFFDKYSNHPVLLAQKASVKHIFYGPIYRLDLDSFKPSIFNLPVAVANFYEFFKVDDKLIYLSPSSQLSIYDYQTDKSKTLPYAFGSGFREILRYPVLPGEETQEDKDIKELYREHSVVIPKGLIVFKKNSNVYILGAQNYMSNHITVAKQAYNAYSLKLFKVFDDNAKLVWSSGDIKGRVVGFAVDGDYAITLIGLPAGFFDRFIMGIEEIDRLVAARMLY